MSRSWCGCQRKPNNSGRCFGSIRLTSNNDRPRDHPFCGDRAASETRQLSARPGAISRDFMVLSAAKDKSFVSVENWSCGELGACGQLSIERLRAVAGCRCGQQIRSTCRRASPAARHARRDTDQVATTADRHRSRKAYGDRCRDRARLGHGANRAGRAPSGWALVPLRDDGRQQGRRPRR